LRQFRPAENWLCFFKSLRSALPQLTVLYFLENIRPNSVIASDSKNRAAISTVNVGLFQQPRASTIGPTCAFDTKTTTGRPDRGSAERRDLTFPSIIGATCAFDTKKYNIVDTLFAVSACVERNKKNIQISYFCSALSSLLVENP